MVCDFAETYHVLNWRELPIRLSATLAFGLSKDSRTMRALSGVKISQDTMLLAAIADRLSIIAWQNTEDGHKGRNQPQSIVKQLMEDRPRAKHKSFASGRAFDEAWKKLAEV